VDLASRIHDVCDGPRVGSAAPVDATRGSSADRLRHRLLAFQHARRARKMGLVFPTAQRLGVACRVFRRGNRPLQTAFHADFRRAHRTGGSYRPRIECAAARIHPVIPGVRLLSGIVAGAQPTPASNPGSPLRRSLLWALHLWLAGRGSGDVAVRRPCRLVAGLPDRFAGGCGDRLPLVASRRAPDAPAEAARGPRRRSTRRHRNGHSREDWRRASLPR